MIRNNPPRQSAVQRKRRPITHHNKLPSVGHGVGTRKPVILDKSNGRFFGGSRPVTTQN